MCNEIIKGNNIIKAIILSMYRKCGLYLYKKNFRYI